MDEAKLSNLTLLRVERDRNTDKDKVFGRFATMKERRMTFLKGTVKCTKFVKVLDYLVLWRILHKWTNVTLNYSRLSRDNNC